MALDRGGGVQDDRTAPDNAGPASSPRPLVLLPRLQLPDLEPQEGLADQSFASQGEDLDSALGSDLYPGSSAFLTTASILDAASGRTFHRYKEGKYIFPNDQQEIDRLDVQHHIFALTYDGKLGLCPMNEKSAKVNRVLDVGAGTGCWAIEFANDHPEASVIGVDLSPIQSYATPNLKFFVDDIEDDRGWAFESKFDYIHSRMMSMSLQNWDRYIQQCYDNLEPGGYLELAEVQVPYQCDDGTALETHAHMRWFRIMMEAGEKLGRPFVDPSRLKEQMERLGFEDVQVRKDKWPVNPWHKGRRWRELGSLVVETCFNDSLESFSHMLCIKGLGWTKEEVDKLLVEVRKNLNDTRIHLYMTVFTVYGRKPQD